MNTEKFTNQISQQAPFIQKPSRHNHIRYVNWDNLEQGPTRLTANDSMKNEAVLLI